MNMPPKNQNLEDDFNKGKLRISDLPGEIQNIAKVIGLKPALKLVMQYGGGEIYIPQYKTITRAVRNRAIMIKFNGTNHKELAQKFGLTLRYIRSILKEASGKNI